jgi:signal recognition particle subunit SRP54
MTPDERRKPEMINGSRRGRIAKGAGVNTADVNNLLKQFKQVQQMMRSMGRGKGGKKGKRGGMPMGLGDLPGLPGR